MHSLPAFHAQPVLHGVQLSKIPATNTLLKRPIDIVAGSVCLHTSRAPNPRKRFACINSTFALFRIQRSKDGDPIMRGMSTVNSLAIILAINCWLFTGGTPNVCGQSNPTANDLRSNTPQSSSTQSVTESQSNNDDDLPWLPGLGGRTLGDRNSAAAFPGTVTGQGGLTQQNRYAQPPIATQAINARPLPGNTCLLYTSPSPRDS